jgi:aldehyde:ferredoxin oxidoreductase
MNGCGMCLFGRITSALPLFEYLNAVTGWEMSADEYYEYRERILSLRKAFNVREGIHSGSESACAAIGKKPLESGPNKGKTVDIDMLQGYFIQSVGGSRIRENRHRQK